MNERLPGPHEVHIRYVFPDRLTDSRLTAKFQAWLSHQERDRQRRFLFPGDRHLYLTAHALVRAVLSSYTGVDPGDWAFTANGYGKPEITEPEQYRRLRFNLSHTAGLAICAVSWEHPIGVDAECLDRKMSSPELLAGYLSREEEARLRQVPESERTTAFLEIWTLKEAYLKCVGRGLSMPLSAFTVELQDRGRAAVRFHPPIDDPARFQFNRFRVGPSHIAALTANRPPEQDLSVSLENAEPLLSSSSGGE